jgi:peptide/nickel transport system substrate-binding protein
MFFCSFKIFLVRHLLLKEERMQQGWRVIRGLAICLGLVICLGSHTLAQDKDTLVVAAADVPPSLDPSQVYDTEDSYIAFNVYEPLIFPDKNGVIQPLLATEWELSEDGKQYAFTLREGVKFHSGNSLRCQDAEYSLRRALVTNYSQTSFSWNVAIVTLGFEEWTDETIAQTAFSDITDAVYCDDAGKLIVNLVHPDPDFLFRLTNILMFDMTWATENGEWSGTESDWQDWIGLDTLQDTAFEQASGVSGGTGAYSLVSNEASRIVCKAFADYWGGKPTLENVIIQPIPDHSARVLALKNGDADLIYALPFPYYNQVKDAPGVSRLAVSSGNVDYLLFNTQIDPATSNLGSGKLDGKGIPADFFSDIHVRRGFAAAYNKERLIAESVMGEGKILRTALASSLGGDDPSWSSIPYDLQLAEAEFKQAWDGQVWEQGFTFDVWLETDEVSAAKYTYLAGLKESLVALNPKFIMNIKEYGDEDTELENGEATSELESGIWLNGWMPDFMTPMSNFQTYFYSGEGKDYYNYILSFGLSDKIIDELLKQMLVEGNPEKRQELYTQLNDRLTETAPVIVMPEITEFIWYRNELTGVAENYNPYTNYTFVFWKELSKD